MTLHRTIRSLARLCAVAALCVAASAPACAAKLVLGAKNFTEQYVLAELTAQYLRARLRRGSPFGPRQHARAQRAGERPVRSHVGLHGHRRARLQQDQRQAVARRNVPARQGARRATRAVWLDASPLNDTYAIGLPSPLAQATGIRTVSQLAEHLKTDPAAKHYVFGMDAEFANRPDGLKPLLAAYGMQFSRAQLKQMDPGPSIQRCTTTS